MSKVISRVRRVLLLLMSAIAIEASALLVNVDLRAQPNTPTIIHLGVFDYLGPAGTESEYAPLVEYLNGVLTDEQVQLHVLSQAELNDRMSQGTIDLVITNPTHYLEARAHYPLTGVIATQVRLHQNMPVYRLGGAILTLSSRQDINRLQDLRGQTVAVRSRFNLGGYRAQAYELYLVGVRVPEDLTALIEMGTHEAAIYAVMQGHADVAFVRDGIFEQMLTEGAVSEGALKVLNPQLYDEFTHHVSTRLYPEWPVFGLRHLDDNVIRRVAAALFSLDPERAKAINMEISGFTVPADYVEVEKLTRALRLPPYDHLPDFTFSDVWLRWQALIVPVVIGFLFILLLGLLLVWHWSKVQLERKRFMTLLQGLGEGVYGCDMQGCCTFINPAALNMLGLAYKDVIGQDQHMIFHYRRLNGSAYPHTECPVHEVLVSGESRQCEDHFVQSNGTLFPVSMTVTPMFEAQVQVGAVVVFQDVSLQKEMQAKLITLTTTDDLTGLYNRRYFQTQLHQEFARFQRSFADTGLLMIDLDHFKQINDQFGHAAGDKVLQDFAYLLKKAQRNSDLSARVGGEEFAMLLPDTNLEDACALANRLREQISAFTFTFEQHTIDVTVSIGCTLMCQEDERPDIALARADRALYQAKTAGRNRVVADVFKHADER